MDSIRKATAHFYFLIFMSVWTAVAGAETLESYTQKCNDAVGVPVTGFNCDDPSKSTAVPTTNFQDENCDEPNRLNKVCDPGSRFQVLKINPKAYIVAHCRKKVVGPFEI